jgi:hypothetical protein
VVPALATLVGCGVHDLALREDDRVSITSPGDGDDVRLPLTVRWTAHDLDGGGAHGTTFGIVIDEALPRPGKVPDEHVLRTTRTSIVLDQLGSSNRPGGRGGHVITIIRLDGEGRRQGEGAWRIRIDLKDPR